jgi:hypothetical protein
MKHAKILPFFLLAILLAISSTACSKGKSPVEPVIDNVPISFGTESENRSVLAVYNAVIDPDNKTFTIEPANRSTEYHFPLTQMFPNVLQITDINWGTDFWVEMQLSHPMPGSGIDGFDPRVIAILPAYPTVSMNYPIFNVHANNHMLIEPDGYTKLFDSINPSIVGNTNPFMAYFKDEPNRVWSSTVTTQETKRWYMNVTDIGGPFVYQLVVDVSTNHPNAPQPVIDNALEPVSIETSIDQGLLPSGGSASIDVTLLDWQGSEDTKIKVECPELFSGSIQLFYSEPGPNPDEYIFSGTISNSNLAPRGDYSLLIAVWDIPSGIHVFHETQALVRENIAFNPVEITPPWMNFSPWDIYIVDNYAYVAGGRFGLHIFDISDQLNPVWVSQVDTVGMATDLHVADDYAYVVDNETGLIIIDVDPPDSPNVVKTINVDSFTDVFVTDGCAYVVNGGPDYTLLIIDVETPETPNLLNAINMPYMQDIYVADGYVYGACYAQGLQIVDVDPPENAEVVSTVHISGDAYRCCVSGDYVYVTCRDGLYIIDITSPTTPDYIKLVDTLMVSSIAVADGYVYVTNHGLGYFLTIDVDPPMDAYTVSTVDIPACPNALFADNGYVYIASGNSGIQIMDVDPPESVFLAGSDDSPAGAQDISVANGCACIADGSSGLQIVDIDPPESANKVKLLDLPGTTYDVHVSDGYAYAIDDSGNYIRIVDIDPPEDAYVVKSIYAYNVSDVYASDGYAYIAKDAGLTIYDVDPPESARFVKTVTTPENAQSVFVTDGYAYVCTIRDFVIMDIDPPEDAYTVNSIDSLGGTGAYVVDGYAYIMYGARLRIWDVDPPESAYEVKYINISYRIQDVFVLDGYAYVSTYEWDSWENGLYILDVNPPENVRVVDSFRPSHFVGNGVDVIGGYAYIADSNGGFRIIDLW